ncbi:MAG: hypothetical protein ACTS77_00035 [Arsenophonus sp. NC-TX2-MAG3]
MLVLILKGIQLKVKANFFLGAQVSREGPNPANKTFYTLLTRFLVASCSDKEVREILKRMAVILWLPVSALGCQ